MAKKYNIHHVPGQHLTFKDREIIALIYNNNLSMPQRKRLSLRSMAKEAGLPYSTFQREIRRGLVRQPMIRNDKEVFEYSEHIAQDDISNGDMNKGCGMKLTNKTAALLAEQIKKHGKSPAHALRDLERDGYTNLPCLSSIYNHIEHGDMGVLHGETPYHPKDRRKRGEPVRRSRKMPGNLSIEDRPDLVLRDVSGHWEMDTVVSCINGTGGLLVLIERKTRFYIIVKIKRITQYHVLKALRKVIRSGQMKVVKSITTDNGGEFLDHKQMTSLFKKINNELKIYYTHAYASWEKGSVENANRHIRRFYPKGTDFSNVTAKQVQALQDFINSIPRDTLEGLDANEAHQKTA